MNMKAFAKQCRRLAEPFCVRDGRGFRLQDFDPGTTAPWGKGDKDRAREHLVQGIEVLTELQDKLYAQDHWAVLLVFQAMDAAGKDSVIKHVMSGVNPQGCEVHSFKAPTSEDLDHDYLWRCQKRLPERGRIGIFNRSYYEEVLVVRVHPEFLGKQKLPPKLVTKRIWEERYQDIRGFERYLSRNGVLIRKFFLNVSRKEQKERFLERLDRPEKNWKFSAVDVAERQHWAEYQQAYQEMIRNTATKEAPWYVVPADHKWFTRAVVVAAVVQAMTDLKLAYPQVDEAKRRELAVARKGLGA